MKPSEQSLYSRLGGEDLLSEFVDHLYCFMERLPEVVHIREMHSRDLSHASERLFMFLSGMLGGPPLYMEAYGHPRLRRKHMHFSIGDKERDQWMLCAQRAADKLDVNADVRTELIAELSAMADHLRNKDINFQSGQPCINTSTKHQSAV